MMSKLVTLITVTKLNNFLRITAIHWQELLLGYWRQNHVYRLSIVVEGRRFAKDGKCTNYRSNREDPEEKSIQDHRYEAPVLIFLLEKKIEEYNKFQMLRLLVILLPAYVHKSVHYSVTHPSLHLTSPTWCVSFSQRLTTMSLTPIYWAAH